MSDPNAYAFRTAVGGFHKGDVADYIAETAQAHQARVEDLERQIEALQAENDRLRQQLLEQPSEAQEAPEETTEPETESLQERELAAYRRAEAAERLATLRAKKLYEELQDVCGRSVRQADASERTVRDAVEIIDQQLEVLRIAAAALHEGLRTSAEELRSMEQLVPDPAEGLED